ncbi:hypothetical protein P43SY_004874 [Pythium insidiosum]|uniref:Symplekin C-terminal domain-containing protein n=1 Tax=Pythium insidiosum TaxID=114742 RepID=A0AAD5LJH0_PYTIN|nr:hypothetical protein P43SY_004874 [Pythium insidiosum]
MTERLEEQVTALLNEIPTAPNNADQVELLQRVEELVLHRDASGAAHRLLHVALPFLRTIAHQRNAPLVAAIVALVSEAARRERLFLRDLFELVSTVLLLSHSSEKNVLLVLHHATLALPDAFTTVCDAGADASALDELWRAVASAVDHVAGVVASGPVAAAAVGADDCNNNRSAAVFLRAWKLLERGVLLLSSAQAATVFRDPARSNVQPDAVTVDRVPAEHRVLHAPALEALGASLCERMCQRLVAADAAALATREACVAVNSLALLAAVRPQHLPRIVPALLACHYDHAALRRDRAVQSTLHACLVKLLGLPSTQPWSADVSECLIALGDGARAAKAITKSKQPRRKYVTAPSEASLRRARLGKRTAERLVESVEHDKSAKRARPATATAAPGSERITHDALVDLPSEAVVNLVLEGFTAELPTPAPTHVKLALPPSELKTRMAALLARLATPSSVMVRETSLRRSRDPRRRRDSEPHDAPALLPVFDDAALDEMSDWVSKNASTIEEPLVSVGEDQRVQVFLRPVAAAWCRDMAAAALQRILDSEYGARLGGDDALREALLCRLAASPWLLSTDERGVAVVEPPASAADGADALLLPPPPPVYRSLLDFALEDLSARASLATALFHSEYVRVTSAELTTPPTSQPPTTTGYGPRPDALYRRAVKYFLDGMTRKMDMTSSSDKKLFGAVIAQLPRVTRAVLLALETLLRDKSGAVLAITVLRDLIKERQACARPALALLLRSTCDADESLRNTSIRCVANQLYTLPALRPSIERYAVRLVRSLQETNMPPTDDDAEMAEPSTTTTRSTGNAPERVAQQLALCDASAATQREELDALAASVEREDPLAATLDSDAEALRRLELYLALCAKQPTLLRHVIVAYGHASELVRQVIFQAIEKLIKHLKQRGSAVVVAQLHAGFDAASLSLICHILQLLAARSSSSSSGSAVDAATAELVGRVLELWRAHESVPEAITVLIPVLPSVPKDTLLPLLPRLLALPPNRWTVALTRILEAMPPVAVSPVDLLLGLHDVDLKADPTMQKKAIQAINFCVEHRHAFPSDVLLHVCRVLVHAEPLSKLALRTVILSVTTYPALQHDVAALLATLVARQVWAMPEDAIWKGFVKCAALVQPASFSVLLERLPAPQLALVLRDEPALRPLLRQFAATESKLSVSDATRAVLLADDEPAAADDAQDVDMASASASAADAATEQDAQ